MLRSGLISTNPAGNESVSTICHFLSFIFFCSYHMMHSIIHGHSWSMDHIKLVHRLYIFSILMSSLTFPTTVLLLTPKQPGRPSSLQARLNLTSPTSAFQTPSINRSTLYYDGRTTPYHTLMKSPLGQGPSPTCVASTVIFDGDVGSVVNYAHDVTAPIPNEHRYITALNIKPKYATYSNPSSGNNGSGRGGGGGRSNRRSSNASNNRPNIASGDGGERPPPPNNNNNPRESPTPQNLRDNPERLAKVKTEMCHFYEEGGVKNCPFGASCEFCILFIYFVGGEHINLFIYICH